MSDAPRGFACQACGAPLRAEDADDARRAARCTFCGSWTTTPGGTPRLAPPRPLVERPRSIRVEPTAFGVRIVRRWFSPVFLFLAFFCVVWNGILAGFYGIALRSGAPVFALLFPVIHVAVGLGLGYVTLCGLFNRTVVEVGRGDVLTVRHTPLPWRGAVSIDAADVAQVYVTEKRTQRRDEQPSSLYTVCVLTRRGRHVPLVRGLLSELDHALFLEQELERHLRIADRPVPGEASRGNRDDDPSE